MSDTIHALIHTFLQAHDAKVLYSESLPLPMPKDQYQKSGIIPYIIEGDHVFYYVMKPTASRPGTPPPKWQLCKGTRMYKSPASGKWKDMRMGETVDNAETEALVTTALREGHEELGLLPESIEKLYEVGPYSFSSAQTGAEKHMWMYIAELDDRNVFLPASHVAATTADRRWLELDEFRVVGREDHLYILEDIQAKIDKIHKE